MKVISREKDKRIVVGLERGERIRASIESFATREKIVGAELKAIGALKDPELAYYDLSTKQYLKRLFPGIWELVLAGNISLKDGKPFLHAHVTIGGRDFQAFCGHLVDAEVGVVVEMFMHLLATPVHRVYCEDIGLPRWEPNHKP